MTRRSVKDEVLTTYQVPDGIVDQFRIEARSPCFIFLRQPVAETSPALIKCTFRGDIKPEALPGALEFIPKESKVRLRINELFTGSVSVTLPPVFNRLCAILSGGSQFKAETPIFFEEMRMHLREAVDASVEAAIFSRVIIKACGSSVVVDLGKRDVARWGDARILATGGAKVALSGCFKTLSARVKDPDTSVVKSRLCIDGPVRDSLSVNAEGGGDVYLRHSGLLPSTCVINVKPRQKAPSVL